MCETQASILKMQPAPSLFELKNFKASISHVTAESIFVGSLVLLLASRPHHFLGSKIGFLGLLFYLSK
jgi:hypothetical protein